MDKKLRSIGNRGVMGNKLSVRAIPNFYISDSNPLTMAKPIFFFFSFSIFFIIFHFCNSKELPRPIYKNE